MTSASLRQLAAALALGLGLGCTTVPTEGQEAGSIVRNTASPFCPGMTLDACPSPAAASWRQEIHAWVAQGVPAEEIRARLQARVPGFELRIAPAKSGWLIPVAAVGLASVWLFVLGLRFRLRARRRAEAVAVAGPGPAADAALDARLDDELSRLDD